MSFASISKLFPGISILLVMLSIGVLLYPGPRLSIDFTGGAFIEIRLSPEKSKDDLLEALRTESIAPLTMSTSVSSTKAGTLLLRMKDLSQEEHTKVIETLEETLGSLDELQFTTIGSVVGTNLKKRASWALFTAAIAIIVYLAFAFRKVPRGISPWTFGLSALAGVVHDVLIVVGIFTVLSYFTVFEMDLLFVTAILSIMGYSVNDTIVIFDRIRDSLFSSSKQEEFRVICERSLKLSMTRTIHTGMSTLMMLLALFFLGAESIRWFILTLIIGIVVGTYSSFFVATPLLVYFQTLRSRSR